MYLKESEITGFVRTRLDELSAEHSDMFLDEVDDRNLDATIISLVEESLSYVHQKAAPNLLEGIKVTEESEGVTAKTDSETGSVDISLGDRKVLRLVSFRSDDSPIVLTEVVDEDSPKGRMQLNEFARGTYDDPVLVLMADTADFKPHYVYYSLKDTGPGSNTRFSLSYYPVPELKTDDNGENSWFISARLKEAVLNQITGMTLRSYKDETNASLFFARCAEYLQ